MNIRFGLSPLARGTLDDVTVAGVVTRFIPAGAGNTTGLLEIAKVHQVYPRWRGEHSRGDKTTLCRRGLSPLARGTQPGETERQGGRRFIPAGAGNTFHLSRNVSFKSVYPRWRGEHLFLLFFHSYHPGLSPLARGTRAGVTLVTFTTRFIPAGAGNTDVPRRGGFVPAVYPRWRGEHYGRAGCGGGVRGLSPLARGTLSPALLRSLQTRFIPAGAGNTHRRHGSDGARPVYPRWRGEHGRLSCG